MPIPFDARLEALWVFDDGDSIVFQTAREGWGKSRLRIVHRLAQKAKPNANAKENLW